MKKTLLIFFGISLISALTLAIFSGGIFVEQQLSPVKEVEKKFHPNETMVFETKDKEYNIYKENRIEDGHYIHYNEKQVKEWEVRFDLMHVIDTKNIRIQRPISVYYNQQKPNDNEWKLAHKYSIISDEAILVKENNDFVLLKFKKNVKIYGYNEKGELTSEGDTDYIDVNLQKKSMATDAPIYMSQNTDLIINAVGMRCEFSSKKIEFLKNVDLSISTEDKNNNAMNIKSQSSEKLELQRIDSNKFTIIQQGNIENKSKNAVLRCKKELQINLERSTKKIYVRKLRAIKEVYFQDQSNIITCEDFLQNSQKDHEEVILNGKSSISLKGEFSLLTGEESQKLNEIREKKQIQELQVEAQEQIKWVKKYDNLFVIENIYMQKNAKVLQVTTKNEKTKISGDKIQLDLVITVDPENKTKKEKREPIYLKAQGNAFYSDKNMEAQTDTCTWKKITATTDHLKLTGKNPTVKLFNVKASNFGESKPSSSDNKNKSTENLIISSNSYIEVKKNVQGLHLCSAEKNVRLERYLTENNENIGNFNAQKIQVKFVSQKEQKVVLEKAIASGKVFYQDKDFTASGGLFNWIKIDADNDKIALAKDNPKVLIQKVKLSESMNSLLPQETEKNIKNAVLEDIDITANKAIVIYKNIEKSITKYSFQAHKNVHLNRYISGTKTNTGKFKAQYLKVHFREEKNIVSDNEKKSKYSLDTMEAHSDVHIEDGSNRGGGQYMKVISHSDGKNILLQKNAWIENETARITGDSLTFDTEKKIFIVQNNVRIKAKEAEGEGKHLTYNLADKTATITGSPAKLAQLPLSEGNTIWAKKIIFAQQKNKAYAYDDVTFTFSNKGNNMSLWAQKDLKNTNAVKKNENKVQDKDKISKYKLTCSTAEATFQTKPTPTKPNNNKKEQDSLFEKEERKLEDFWAKDNVTIINMENPKQRATGTSLRYISDKVILLGNPAQIYYDDNQINSDQFEFITENKEAVSKGPATIYLPRKQIKSKNLDDKVTIAKNGEKIKVTCKGQIKYLDSENRIQLFDDVVITLDDKILEAQKVEVIMNDGEVKEFIAYDHVILTSGKNKAYGSQLRWNEEKQKVFITDYPHVIFKGEGTKINVPVLYYQIDEDRFYTQGRNITAEKYPPVSKTKEKNSIQENK